MEWYGFGEDYVLSKTDDSYMQAWTELLAKAKKWKFNTVRLAFSFPDSNGSQSVLDITKLTNVLNLLKAEGLKAILDLHNWQDMPGYFGSTAWALNWLALAQALVNNTTVVGYELFNEPTASTWDGVNVKSQADGWKVYSLLTAEIRKTDLVKSIIWDWTGLWSDCPVEYRRSDVVVAFHPWSGVVNETHFPLTQEEADLQLSAFVNQIRHWKNDLGFQVWNGEFGVHYVEAHPPEWTESRYNIEKYYASKLINKCLENGCGFNWWLYSRNHWVVGSADDVLGASQYRRGGSNVGPIVAAGLLLLSVVGLAAATSRRR